MSINGASSSAPPGPPAGIPPRFNGAPPGPPPGAPPASFSMYQPTQAPPPPIMMGGPPPLPAGWSEHRAPDGITPYFYNSITKDSTYKRPAPIPAPPFMPVVEQEKDKKKKKEKPKNKIVIPGTSWTRVTTNEGNTFYFEKESKRSEWSVPDEIRDAVETFDRGVKEEEERKEKERREEELRELERIRLEVQEETKKRKIENAVEEREKKIAKTEQEALGPADEEDEEAWMKAVAAEFKDVDQEKKDEKKKEKEDRLRAEEEAAKQVFAVPDKVNVSVEEGRALFKALLNEKEISPFAPWETSLPLFINDPRYILLSSLKDRKEVFEEYCRDAGRAKRLSKVSSDKKGDPEKEYRALMREEVISTRTRWDDFRRKWRKDRRFFSFGRDDRDREKAFKVHLRELGERKREDAQRAEQDFIELIQEVDLSSSSVWTDVKKKVSHDARYDAVGSSSLREELFNNHITRLASSSGNAVVETSEMAAEKKIREKKEREAASLKERQDKVSAEQRKVNEETQKSRVGAGREEAERRFGSLLVDMVRDHDTTWPESVEYLSADARFNHASLSMSDKLRLFKNHLAKISNKRFTALHQLFASHALELTTPYEEVYPKIVDDYIVKKLGLEGEDLEDRFHSWNRGRKEQARRDFDVMLGENSFVEFWGRMRKKTLDEEALKIKEDEDAFDEGEGAGGGGAADLTGMAKQIDLKEILAVLKRDRRYRIFDHIPEVREQWLKDYLENLEATDPSKTIHSVGSK
ncbi:transcription elongation regulator 1, partial [Tremellales sp. Uapishka_1]